ncbi:hypothetical protein A2642_04120 [Candidatus Nomurabacteria bacterium RIFCSPHIGHO2_01_FULL_39_10]|uniref:acireductone dioxygenase (Fe(2+)-requiring) n=1 Tax=Candidatus Nomurabacteria bacterium RIFCSPHIGHO2_01_FULL_39_10 TaxID=1801733 RepID=A0A1F6V7K9_9BACT|nr:MAG: hypothetical protein A2642_04120 [Candidatus Nomurabacteria bacterium RIFCSPHIGHO2_01_FULL_39_10]
MQAKYLTTDQPLSIDDISQQGILYDYILPHPTQYQSALDIWKQRRGYQSHDEVTLTPQTPNLTGIIETFYKEHLHTDDEARYILSGSGIFDVRSKQDEWMRISVQAGDLIIVPANTYHRFKLTEEKSITAVRLFKDNPSWVPVYRPQAINQE